MLDLFVDEPKNLSQKNKEVGVNQCLHEYRTRSRSDNWREKCTLCKIWIDEVKVDESNPAPSESERKETK